jgi:hypothetical protein
MIAIVFVSEREISHNLLGVLVDGQCSKTHILLSELYIHFRNVQISSSRSHFLQTLSQILFDFDPLVLKHLICQYRIEYPFNQTKYSFLKRK